MQSLTGPKYIKYEKPILNELKPTSIGQNSYTFYLDFIINCGNTNAELIFNTDLSIKYNAGKFEIREKNSLIIISSKSWLNTGYQIVGLHRNKKIYSLHINGVPDTVYTTATINQYSNPILTFQSPIITSLRILDSAPLTRQQLFFQGYSNKRLFSSNGKPRPTRIESALRHANLRFSIDSKKITGITAGTKIQSIPEKIGFPPFNTDISQQPIYSSNKMILFGGDQFLNLPIPLTDSNFPNDHYRLGFYIIEFLGQNQQLSIFSPTLGCSSSPSYRLLASSSSSVYGANIPILPQRLLLTEIINESKNYCLWRVNQKEVLGEKVQSVSSSYSIESIGKNFIGYIGEINLYCFKNINSINIEATELMFNQKWNCW